jgi:two-component system, response regulator
MLENLVEILLVEDSPHDVELTLHAFRKNNISNCIHIVNDGAQALDFLFCRGVYEHRSPDGGPQVILLDLKLPLVDGLEVLGQIKADPRTRHIPVVVLTSSREDRDLFKCYQMGVNSYIVKPVDFQQFTEAVRRIGFYWLLLNQFPAQDKYLLRKELCSAISAS